jgi:hypothetical protein
MKVFYIGLEIVPYSLLKKMGRCGGPGAGGPGYPGIQYTDISPREPYPLTCPLEGAKGTGPPEATRHPNGTRPRTWSGGHVEAQR